MKNLIIGKGEVGSSLYRVLKDKHETYIRDVEELKLEGVEVLNICFPYFIGFESAVRGYIKEYKPKLVIVHSTVPVGTCRKLGVVHSPIHGKHPNLAQGIKTFTKYIGGAFKSDVALAVKFLKKAGIKTKVVELEASELSKILCTTYYGWNIVFQKEVKKICDKLDVNFDDVYGWTQFYNDGYRKLGMEQFVRPLLSYKKGKIGGHCVVPNTKLLKSWLTDTLSKRNNSY